MDFEKRLAQIKEESALSPEELSTYLRSRMFGSVAHYPFVMARPPFEASSLVDPNAVDLTAVTATTEAGLWTVANQTPIPALYPRSGQTFELVATGIMSTAASASTLIITPRYGTTTGGVTLGPSVTQTVPASLTAVGWYMHAILNFRKVDNSAATQSVVMCGGVFVGTGTIATAGTAFTLPFGGTSGTVDTTAAGGLFIGWTLSVAGSVTPRVVFWKDI
jgi:hypothetical protein